MAKSKPIGVRFDLYKLEMIQKEQNLTSAQAVVNYLMDNYHPVKDQKSLIDIIDITGEPNILANIAPNLAFKPENGICTTKNKKEPPEGLKGIDLTIWKSENWK